MNDDLQVTARRFAAALPASIELPAGAGKTHLLAATVGALSADGGRALVLTHTNAGVHAIEKRLKEFGVRRGQRVATITSFAFTLARAYPKLGRFEVPAVPNWSDSGSYVAAATQVGRSIHIRRVLSASFTHLLVDEYQDCSQAQHDFICTLAESVPATGVLGDRLQAIFGFGDTLVAWTDVELRFPKHDVPLVPWRWRGHNEELGQWLLEARDRLVPGKELHLGKDLPRAVTFEASTGDPRKLRAAAHSPKPADETVLVLTGPGKHQPRAAASRLGGQYSAMEEISGDFMHQRLVDLAETAPGGYASWLAQLIRSCYTPYGGIDSAVQRRLDEQQAVAHLKRPGFEQTLVALDEVLEERTLASIVAAMEIVFRTRAKLSPRLHSHEAWFDIQTAIRGAVAAGGDAAVLPDELARIRDRIRHAGRSDRRRVVSRTVLVKGLEYDHVVIEDVTAISDAHNLYVALTRARKSVVIIGASPVVSVTATSLGPKRSTR